MISQYGSRPPAERVILKKLNNMISLSKSSKSIRATLKSFLNSNTTADTNAENKNGASCFYTDYDTGSDSEIEETPCNIDWLAGEVLVASTSAVARHVLFANDTTTEQMGVLAVTNYRVCFSTSSELEDESAEEKRNKLIGSEDVALASIVDIYYISKGRRKKLLPGQLTSVIVKRMEIHTMDFRILSLSFEQTESRKAKRLINAILHHSAPNKPELLFGFSFQWNPNHNKKSHMVSHTPEFLNSCDWECELNRLRTRGYFVSECNRNFSLTNCLPEFFVLPQSLSDVQVKKAGLCSDNNCFPIWSYSHTNGSALVRMAAGRTEYDELQVMHHVKLSHPSEHNMPKVIDVDGGNLPKLKDLQISLARLRELCMPSSYKELGSSDSLWLSMLESCQWLTYVRLVLCAVVDVVDTLVNKSRTVMIKEKGGTDLTPVITCLVQLLLDRHCRTIEGFHMLIEREWVALGHKFTQRYLLPSTKDTEQSPVFLLFLDCIWQLLHQFPSSFEFSEIYLTSLWDSLGMGIFRNFIFASMEKKSASMRDPSTTSDLGVGFPPSVWDWNLQFYREDVVFFSNPLYRVTDEISALRGKDKDFNTRCLRVARSDCVLRYGSRNLSKNLATYPSVDSSRGILLPRCSSNDICLWEHCYLRWLTPTQIVDGGMPAECFVQNLILQDIVNLQDQLDIFNEARPAKGNLHAKKFKDVLSSSLVRTISKRVSSSFPFSPSRPSNSMLFLPILSIPSPGQDITEDDSVSILDFDLL